MTRVTGMIGVTRMVGMTYMTRINRMTSITGMTRITWDLSGGWRYLTFEQLGPGARFSKVPIINGPGKLSPFALKIEVSMVLHLTR